MHKIYLDMIGCRLNQSELERIGERIRRSGHLIVADPAQADTAIINTCAVTAKASSDSRQLARRISKAGVGQIILTGCWASVEAEEAASLNDVTHVIPNTQKDQIVEILLQPNRDVFDFNPLQRQPLPGARKRTRAFIKVQDGCDKRCTFCITTIARGPSRSLGVEEVLSQVQSAAEGGVKEVILTGVQLGAWGSDLGKRDRLERLISTLLTESDIPRIRLSSIEPWGISGSLLSLWQDPRLCRQIHLPLQSGSIKTLRRMARNISPARFKQLVEQIRNSIHNAAITTDLIVGFPGESDADFEESLRFVERMEFAGGHVFSFSERPGTAAARFSNPVPHSLRRERSERMRSCLDAASRRYQKQFIGTKLSVLWESLIELDGQGWTLKGYSSEGVKVHARGFPEERNQIQQVDIQTQHDDGSLVGEIVRKLPKA